MAYNRFFQSKLTVYHPVVVHLAWETVGSQLLIDIEDYQVPSSPLYLATPPEIMGQRRNQKSVLVPRAHRLRRLQNSTLNASVLAQLRLPPPPVNRSIDQYGLYPPVPDEEMEQNLWDDCDEEEGDLLDNAIEQLQWVTLEEEQPLPQIDPQIESTQERHRLLARECNWLALIEQMHARYMILKLHTHNWARSNTYESFPIQCVCPPHLMYLRKAKNKTKLHFAVACMMPFDFYTKPFTVALTEWLERRSQRLCAKNQTHARDLQNPFGAAVDMFRLLEEKNDTMIESVLNLTDQEVLAGCTCPACFGPRSANHADYKKATRDRLIICIDGNFQHRHHSKASQDYKTLCTPHIFLPEGSTDSMTREIRHMEALKKTPSQVS
ncbi:hypothetical protein PCANC_07132 [Puccinia coronata f. sp. avenae]|uniref:CxC1-like cysteine cluster associated with KDZ transposases domain-containing protein n=1 Tax=Puccinia coronata f. sp. avenae TaxID=200324 RepID=A0A2N5VIQ3_9BASI|nr:hypothetical protein PCANC_15768 [Puccinia coronata f. sp. avenae]PLW49870.1 hypothetical protein PCANC_07132 [Puccinia coronata f. sp. avenae]